MKDIQIDWVQKGVDAAQSKDFDNAILYFQKAFELNPKSSEICYNLGLAYLDNGNMDKAIQIFERAIEINPENFRANYNLGLSCTTMGISTKQSNFTKKHFN